MLFIKFIGKVTNNFPKKTYFCLINLYIMKITIVSGARPNFMKIAPITRAIKAAQEAGKKISYRLIYTGRQDDTSLDASLFSDLDMKKPDGYLGVSGHDQSEVTAAIMLAFEKELNTHPAQVVLVVDDLTATMSCSIVAKKRGLKVAHLIAGTRSFDMNMPREVNRTIVDAISDYLFTAGMVANRNLNQEGMIPEYIHYVGNILIDTVRYNRHRLLQPVWFSTMGLKGHGYLLLTLNRHELLNKKNVLKSLIQTLVDKSEGMPIIAPLHPYVQKAIKVLEIPAPNPELRRRVLRHIMQKSLSVKSYLKAVLHNQIFVMCYGAKMFPDFHSLACLPTKTLIVRSSS